MSCPPEAALLLYVESELGGQELRELESHLIACRDCRAHVVALGDESRLLGDVLLERDRPLAPARDPMPEPGVALGLPAAIAAVTAALTGVGLLVEWRMPGGLDVLNPLRLKGAYEMAFDLVFVLRDRAPGLLELALSIGAVAGVSAVLTFAVGVVYRRVYGATAALAVLALLSAAPEPARALTVRVDQDTRVAADEVVRQSMLLTGDVVHVDGVVEGDVIVSAERVAIGGAVKGNVYALCRNLEITGSVEGSLHGVVEETLIDGEIRGSVYALGESIVLAPGGVIGRDFSAIAENGILGGRVARDVVFGGEALELRSEVGRDVDVRWAERVSLRDGARIAGRLDAALEDESDLDRAPGAVVTGAVEIHPRHRFEDHRFADYTDPRFYVVHALGFVAAFLFGLLLRTLFPALFEAGLSTSPQLFRSLGYGFLVVVATPIAIVLVALTVVGLPIAVLALFVYIVMIYSAEILVGAWLGRVLLPPPDASLLAFARSFFLGLALLVVAVHLPFVGLPLMIVSTLIGVGLFFDYARRLAPLRA